jgi:hypothetical protein
MDEQLSIESNSRERDFEIKARKLILMNLDDCVMLRMTL